MGFELNVNDHCQADQNVKNLSKTKDQNSAYLGTAMHCNWPNDTLLVMFLVKVFIHSHSCVGSLCLNLNPSEIKSDLNLKDGMSV